eukprot:6176939-Pleurochrysis_carterae.AAC.1
MQLCNEAVSRRLCAWPVVGRLLASCCPSVSPLDQLAYFYAALLIACYAAFFAVLCRPCVFAFICLQAFYLNKSVSACPQFESFAQLKSVALLSLEPVRVLDSFTCTA